MKIRQNFPESIVSLFDSWAEALREAPDDQARIDYFRRQLPVLMEDMAFFHNVLEKITRGRPFPDISRCGLFENEIVLFTNPSNLFSLRIAAYEPEEYTIVHDHSSWGVFGTICGELETIRYDRCDDSSREGFAKVTESSRLLLSAGEVDSTLPLNDGIHSIGNPGKEIILTASIYGKPLRRLFIQQFDPAKNQTQKIFPPKMKKKLQAQRALKLIGITQ